MLKKCISIVLTSVLLLGLCGCGRQKGAYVYYLNFKPEADAAWQELAKEYTEKTSNAIPQQPCKYCGAMILEIPGRKEKKFCSDDCRNRWWNKHLAEATRKNMSNYVCPACGKTFSAYGKRNRKYCSHECYITDRFGGVACR